MDAQSFRKICLFVQKIKGFSQEMLCLPFKTPPFAHNAVGNYQNYSVELSSVIVVSFRLNPPRDCRLAAPETLESWSKFLRLHPHRPLRRRFLQVSSRVAVRMRSCWWRGWCGSCECDCILPHCELSARQRGGGGAAAAAEC